MSLMNCRCYLYRNVIYKQLLRGSCRSFVHRAKRISLTPLRRGSQTLLLAQLCFH